jgi:hypothetical protein
MHNIMTYVVRHCLQNALVAEANEAAQRAPSAEEQQATDAANTQAALAAAMAAPPGVAVPIPTSTPVGLAAPFSQPAAPPPTLRNVIVGRHNGTLTFQTQDGAGTVFTIRLPIHPAQAGQPEEKAA